MPSAGAIQSAPLAPPVAAAALPRPSAPAVSISAAGAVRTVAASAGGSFGPWSTAGGTPVTVAPGESASVLAARYGVPMEALVRANGLTSASQVTPGKALVVPVYNAVTRTAASAAPASARPSAAPLRTAAKAVTRAPVAAPPRVAAATRMPPQKAAEPTGAARRNAVQAAKPAKEVAKKVAKSNVSAQARESAQKPNAVAQKPSPAPARQQVAAIPAAAPAASVVNDKPEFRWPARGRIIQGFKNGANDGISIAVPEGTAVKAAESGVVAYAGSELKGYGNLVLIRHPNGFVSAYAHNGELNVKRGENVRRGQTIAKSGQSGNVAAPQLHFELRKGSTPVDPTQYLAGL